MKKRVLEITPHFGFAHDFIGKRFRYLSENGYEMHLISSPDNRIDSFSIDNNVQCYPLPLSRIVSLKNDITALMKICSYIRKNKIEAVVGHADKGKLMATLCGLLTNRKVIIFAHGTSFETRKGFSKRVFIMLDRFESSVARKVICVSPFLKELRAETKIDKTGKSVVPAMGSCGGIDCQKFNSDNVSAEKLKHLKEQYGIQKSDFVIGFCGRIVKDKGVEELVMAFERFKMAIGNNVRLLLIGSEDIRDGISKDVKEIIRHDHSIICTGQIDSDIEYYYSMMDVFVLPTHRDGFGMCLIEAAAMGVPVLTTNITGSRDAINNGYNGLYIQLSPNDIAEKLFYLFQESKLRQEMGNNGRGWAKENFSNEIVWKAIKNIYDSVI